VDFVNKEHISRFQVGQQSSEVTCLFEDRAGRIFHGYDKLVSNDMS
jgi:hypothetical protein